MYKTGDDIHVKLLYKDERARRVFYGKIIKVRPNPSFISGEQMLYDVELGQIDAPAILITNLPKGLVLAGGPPEEEAES